MRLILKLILLSLAIYCYETSPYLSYKAKYPKLTYSIYVIVNMECKIQRVNRDIIMAIIDHESARTWNPKITNGYDDGLMQVNRVHQIYDVYNPRVNISFGFKYYKKCLVKKKSLSVAIMAYNAGPNRQVYTNYRYLQQILRRI